MLRGRTAHQLVGEFFNDLTDGKTSGLEGLDAAANKNWEERGGWGVVDCELWRVVGKVKTGVDEGTIATLQLIWLESAYSIVCGNPQISLLSKVSLGS